MTEPGALRLVAANIAQLGKKSELQSSLQFLSNLLGGLCIGLAFLDERCLRRTSQWLAAAAERLGLAAGSGSRTCPCVGFAFLDEGRLGRAGQWLASAAERFGLAVCASAVLGVRLALFQE